MLNLDILQEYYIEKTISDRDTDIHKQLQKNISELSKCIRFLVKYYLIPITVKHNLISVYKMAICTYRYLYDISCASYDEVSQLLEDVERAIEQVKCIFDYLKSENITISYTENYDATKSSTFYDAQETFIQHLTKCMILLKKIQTAFLETSYALGYHDIVWTKC